MKLLVLGPGCAKCKALADAVEQAARELGIPCELNKISSLSQIVELGVMITPALVINGTLKVSGKVPSVADLKSLLIQSQSEQQPVPNPDADENPVRENEP